MDTMTSNHGNKMIARCGCGCKQGVYVGDRFDLVVERWESSEYRGAGSGLRTDFLLRGHNKRANHSKD